MNFDSPPPSDACPELTPDNGTPTSSTSGSVHWIGVNHQGQEDASNSRAHNNTQDIFENNNHQALPSRVHNATEQNNVPARVPPTGGFQYTRSPYPRSTTPPSIDLRGIERPEAIPFISIGPPLVPPLRSPWSPRPHSDSAVRFAGEPTVMSPSPPPTTPSQTAEPSPRSPFRVVEGFRWLRDLVRNFFNE